MLAGLVLVSMFYLVALPSAVNAFPGPPIELYSPLVAEKISEIALSPPNPMKYPQYTDRVAGDWQYFVPDLWTSGFFPATLYVMHSRAQLCEWGTGNASQWLTLGRQWSAPETPLETNNTVGHDVGFLSYPFVDELEVNPHNQTAITVVNRFAADLAARFSPIVGCTRSWDTADPTDFEVIIDNMMNLEVLFVSASLTGNNTLREIAVSHANKTMQNQIRPDGSSFHVVEYNATTGAVIARFTAQGYANYRWNSIFFPYGCISQELHTVHGAEGKRGGSMDFLICINIRNTLITLILRDTWPRTSSPTFHLMGSFLGPYCWSSRCFHVSDESLCRDFNAPLEPSRPADSSAAMIAVNGLFLLSQQERSLSPPNMTGSAYYINAAIQVDRLYYAGRRLY
ncbi:hypothetical protein AcV5_005683 [Taiwanofungus camphoratus]|nr:hypothetical protein AcV5_005683 [Antrodia cinnamomea]